MGAFLRKYGTGTGADIYLPMIKRGVVDQAVSADWTPAAGDVKISIDGAAAANIGTLPTAIAMGNGAEWKFVFADAELQGKRIVVTVADSATKAVEDQFFVIETYGNASAMYQADLSAANLPANVTQFGGIGGTFIAGRPEVLLTPGTGSGEVLLLLGSLQANLEQILGTDLTESVMGRIAAAFSTWGNVAIPVSTAASVNQTGDAYAEAVAVLVALQQIPEDVWDHLLTGTAFSVSNSIGQRIVQYLNVAVSSRLSGTATISATVDLSSVLAAIADIPEDVWGHLLSGTAFSTSNTIGERVVAYLDRTISSRLSGTATLSASVGTAGLWDDLDRWYQEHKNGTGDLAHVWLLGSEPIITSHVTDQVPPDSLQFTIDGGAGTYLSVNEHDTLIRLTDLSTGVVETRVVSTTGASGGDLLIYVNEGFSFTPAFGDRAELFSTHTHDTSSLADAVWDEPMAGHTLANTSGGYLNTLITNVAALLVRIPSALFSGVTSLRGWLRLMIRSDAFVKTQEAASLAEINSGTGTYDNTVASLQALGGLPGLLDLLAGTADAIRNTTDQFVFTTPGRVDASANVSVTLGTDDIASIADSIIAAIDASGVLVNALTDSAKAAIRAAVAGSVVYPSTPRDRTGQRITLYLGDRYGTGGRELSWSYAATAVPWMVAGAVKMTVRDQSGQNQATFDGVATLYTSGGVDYVKVSYSVATADWGDLTDGEGEFWVFQEFGETAGTATMTAEHGTAVIIDDRTP